MTQGKSGNSLIGKIGSYLQIITKDPRSTAFVPLAEAYRQIGLLDDALEAANLGTRMLPHFSPGFATKGRILGQMGRIDEAMSAYARALSIDRQSQAALIGLARLHLIRTERDQARKILKQAAEFHPDDVMISNMLTALDLPRPWAEIQQSPELKEVVAVSAPDETSEEDFAPIPTATLAEIYVKQGLIDKAIKVYQDILVLDPDNQSARERINQLAQAGKEPAAVAIAQKPVTPEPVEAFEMPEPAADQVPSLEPAVQSRQAEPASSKDQSPLAVLERWLTIIKQGKAHVQ